MGKSYLNGYLLMTTLLLLYLIVVGFSKQTSNVFEEITVERINVVEPDGKLKMVISNKARQHPGMQDGVLHQPRERSPGILFFNEEQDEIGGFGFYGNTEDGGNNLFFSYDQLNNDQIMQMMQYSKKNGDNKYGMIFWDRSKNITTKEFIRLADSLENEGYNYPQKLRIMKEMNGGKPIVSSRMFLGRDYNTNTGIFIKDKNGIDRLKIFVDSMNVPRIEVLNDDGTFRYDLIKAY